MVSSVGNIGTSSKALSQSGSFAHKANLARFKAALDSGALPEKFGGAKGGPPGPHPWPQLGRMHWIGLWTGQGNPNIILNRGEMADSTAVGFALVGD